jgi:CRP-like cAMP-binding protein
MTTQAFVALSSRPRGLPPLSATDVAQEMLSNAARRHLRDVGELLRAARPFAGLSAGEAAVLATFTEVLDTATGDILVHQGDMGDDLFVVCSGAAEVRVHNVAGAAPMSRLEPGDHFGEIALVTGGTRSADVVAVTPMTVLRIRSDVYRRYLAPLVDVELEVTRTAAARLRRTSAVQRAE